jgi:hypothetical protein
MAFPQIAEVFLQERLGYIRSNAIHTAAITTKHSTLPSGPTDPPVNHTGPWKDELNR